VPRRLLATLLPALVPLTAPASPPEPVPDKVVVLTFDDASASHHAVARPLLKPLGFGATFFITEGFTFRTNKRDYLTWEQIAELHRDGFEIGNHTRDHLGITEKNVPRLAEQLEAIAARCREHGIPAPVSFAWPGNKFHASALPVLEAAGIRFARRGGEPEVPYAKGGGMPYEPGVDHPLLIPTTADARPVWTLDHVKAAVAQARDGRIAVLQFHGVPDGEHPWVNTPRERFEEYMLWLKETGCTVIALRDIARFTAGRPVSQPLLVPLTLELDPLPAAVLKERQELLTAAGFEFEEYGRNFWRLAALPTWLEPADALVFVRDLLAEMARREGDFGRPALAYDALAKLAVARARRKGDALADGELLALAEALFRTAQPGTCPKGRRTYVEWSDADLGRRFG